MISLWTPHARAAEKLRSLFKYNRFELGTPDRRETEDILSVIAPVAGQPDRMSLFGISIHLSEGLQPYLDSLTGFSPFHLSEGLQPYLDSLTGFSPFHLSKDEPAPALNYETAYEFLSRLPVERRQIARPDFINSHHGFLCLGGTDLTDRLALSLQKRLGKPAFIVNQMPFAKAYGLDYRFSPGIYNLSRLYHTHSELAESKHSDGPDAARHAILILNTDDIDGLRASSGEAYIYKVRDLLSSLTSQNISELQIIWQSNQSPVNQRRRDDFQQFITQCAPELQTRWATQIKDISQDTPTAIFTLSAFNGLPIARKTSRLIYTLQNGSFDGLGGTKPWDDKQQSIFVSSHLTSAQMNRQKQTLSWLKAHYSFDNALTSRARFKSVMQEVVLNGVPKI